MKNRNLITVIVMSLFFFGMFAWTVMADTPDYSDSERRVLASFPEVSIEDILDGDFAEGFDQYAVERFPGRDTWRSLKSYASKVFLQKDNNGIYTAEGHISKIEYPMNTDMLDYVASVFTKVNEKYLTDANVYFAIVPDKNRYLAEKSGYLSLDYDEFTAYMTGKLDFAEYIEIADLLDAHDYYNTDSHWRQEKIVDVAERISSKMGCKFNDNFEVETATTNFEGVYLGQSALRWQPDTINYLINDAIKNAEVSIYGEADVKPVYNDEKLKGKDPYEMFLSGNQPVVTIKNDNNNSGNRLIMFRDSFGSSIAPLLIESYSEIILVDLRYISSDMIGEYVDFSNADVLFIYSTSMLNNSLSLK